MVFECVWVRRKHLKVFILQMLLLFLISHPVYAEMVDVVTEEMPPFNYTKDGVITGFSTEIVKEVLKETGIRASFKSYPWKRAYQMALTNPSTIIYSIGRNPQRENKFKWVGVITPVNIYFYKLKSRTDISFRSLEEAKRFTIGVVREDYTTQFLISQKFTNLDTASSYVLNLRKLFEGRVALILVDELTISSLIRKEAAAGRKYTLSQVEKVMFVKAISSGMYMAFSKKTPDAVVERCKIVL